MPHEYSLVRGVSKTAEQVGRVRLAAEKLKAAGTSWPSACLAIGQLVIVVSSAALPLRGLGVLLSRCLLLHNQILHFCFNLY